MSRDATPHHEPDGREEPQEPQEPQEGAALPGPAPAPDQAHAPHDAPAPDPAPAPAGDGAPEPADAGVAPGPSGADESAYELLQRGTALMRRRHNAQAAVILERAARLEPGKGSILEALGRACFNSAQHARAAEVFEALLEVDPSSHYGHFALGQSLKKLGRPRDAWTHLRLAVALSPGSALYRAALARTPPPERAQGRPDA